MGTLDSWTRNIVHNRIATTTIADISQANVHSAARTLQLNTRIGLYVFLTRENFYQLSRNANRPTRNVRGI